MTEQGGECYVENPSVALRFSEAGTLSYVDLARPDVEPLAYTTDDEKLHAIARENQRAVVPQLEAFRTLPAAAAERLQHLIRAGVYCAPHPGMQIQYGPSQYYSMLVNTNRMLPYLTAIAAQVRPEHLVVELGAGLGIFALFAAKLGAKVISVEPGASQRVSEQLARDNGLTDRIEFVRATLDAWPTMDRKADVMISEFVGRSIFDENIVGFHREARRNLAPGGKLIPCKLSARIQAVQCEELRREVQLQRNEVQAIGRSIGLDLTAYARTVGAQHQSEVLQRTHYAKGRVQYDSVFPVSNDVEIASVTLATDSELARSGCVDLAIEEDGFIDAFSIYFEADLGAGVVLTNGAFSPEITSIQQDHKYHPASGPRRFFRSGERAKVKWAYLGDGFGSDKQDGLFITQLVPA